jgi:hypothetical protein
MLIDLPYAGMDLLLDIYLMSISAPQLRLSLNRARHLVFGSRIAATSLLKI